jgi:hypothetical protein
MTWKRRSGESGSIPRIALLRTGKVSETKHVERRLANS